jgi:hypothetical protein
MATSASNGPLWKLSIIPPSPPDEPVDSQPSRRAFALTRSIRSHIERPRIENHTVSQDGKEANSTQAPGLCATIRLPGGASERAAWRRLPLLPPQPVAVSATPRASGPIMARARNRPSVLNTLRALSDAVHPASTLSAGACGYVAWASVHSPERSLATSGRLSRSGRALGLAPAAEDQAAEGETEAERSH